jgi:hypothetical protein
VLFTAFILIDAARVREQCRDPIGLAVPAILKQANLDDQEEMLNKLLQELAWDVVLKHPLSRIQN